MRSPLHPPCTSIADLRPSKRVPCRPASKPLPLAHHRRSVGRRSGLRRGGRRLHRAERRCRLLKTSPLCPPRATDPDLQIRVPLCPTRSFCTQRPMTASHQAAAAATTTMMTDCRRLPPPTTVESRSAAVDGCQPSTETTNVRSEPTSTRPLRSIDSRLRCQRRRPWRAALRRILSEHDYSRCPRPRPHR
jgi:hypothetical protein